MRDYGKVAPQFWTGDTGKRLKAAGPEAVIVALYLMTSPHANMIGLFYMPELYMAHETGLGVEGATKGLRSCIEADFCTYDAASEYVFVHEMAKHQVADTLKPTDNRCAGIEKDLSRIPESELVQRFHARYGAAFHLTMKPSNSGADEAPAKPLRSQEQEQEQEKEEPNGSLSAKAAAPNCPHDEIIALYHDLLPTSPRIKVWDGDRAKALRTRWREDPKRQTLGYWRRLFGYVAQSPFLTGQREGRDGRAFTPGLDWLVKSANFAKVIEGRYHEEAA